jgi:hypothetical protein
VSVITISGCGPPSRFKMTSRTWSESRMVPVTTAAPIPATWSLIAFNQVIPRR